jgi:hypothetical protein
VASISHTDLAAAIAAADAAKVYRVRVIDRNQVRVDVTDGLHIVGDSDERGQHVFHRFHGEPDYVIVKRVAGKWVSDGVTLVTY